MSNIGWFRLEQEILGWLTTVVRKHVELDAEDERSFAAIIRDARFYETALHLQLEMGADSTTTDHPTPEGNAHAAPRQPAEPCDDQHGLEPGPR